MSLSREAVNMAGVFAVACAAAVRAAPPEKQDGLAQTLLSRLRQEALAELDDLPPEEQLAVFDEAARILREGLDLSAFWLREGQR